MRIGIVGSRRRNTIGDYLQIENLLLQMRDLFGADLVVVSGKCPKGADKHAYDACKKLGIPLVEFPALFYNVTGIENYARAYYARNTAIAEFCERLYAQVADDRTGGTEDTIEKAIKLGRSVYLIRADGKVVSSAEPRPINERKLTEYD